MKRIDVGTFAFSEYGDLKIVRAWGSDPWIMVLNKYPHSDDIKCLEMHAYTEENEYNKLKEKEGIEEMLCASADELYIDWKE